MALVIYKHSASCFKNSICIARKETLCVIAFNEIESLLVLVFRHLVNYNITCAVVVILLQRTTEPPIRHGILSLKKHFHEYFVREFTIVYFHDESYLSNLIYFMFKKIMF